MIARKASQSLRRVPVTPALAEREGAEVASCEAGLPWPGAVQLVAERAVGISAARWQREVRSGLLERALAMGTEHRAGPHRARPEIALRLLAHVDALAEAGLSLAELHAFAAQVDLSRPGALWVVTLLTGCLDLPALEEAFEAWIGELDPALFDTYDGVVEVADALTVQPNPGLRQRAGRWASHRSPVLAACALEAVAPEELSDESLRTLSALDNPIVFAAVDRFLVRTKERPRLKLPRASWVDLPIPALAFASARARLLARDTEPLLRLRAQDARALSALGPYAIDVLALVGSGADDDLVRSLLPSFPSTSGLLDALGRLGTRAVFPRLLAELGSDELDDVAHHSLLTALGPAVERPSAEAWTRVVSGLPGVGGPQRLRGGSIHSARSIVGEMARPDLSAGDLQARADELSFVTGKLIPANWEAFGVSLDAVVADLARLVR
jgi:hypothetical protein